MYRWLLINLINFEKVKIKKRNQLKKKKSKKYLWFVYIGGYDPSFMQEKHEFGLVTALNKLEAKNIAKSKWLIGCKKSIKMILLLQKC